MTGAVTGADGVARCAWAGGDPLYAAYHDDEWGRPIQDDDRLYGLLCLEGFQAGLAWITILRKRPAFEAAFDGFAIDAVARFGEADVERLVADPGIVRHRGKIEATIANARASVALRDGGGLAALVWSHAPPPRTAPLTGDGDIPPSTPESTALSKALRRHGFRFVGPTTVYAFMQSAGLVNDHVAGCPCWEACARLDRR
jgi:DNA-3-methyladenine glycosylase I